MTIISSEYSVEVNQIQKDDWSEVIQLFNDSNIYQTWSYGAVRWGKANLSHLILKKNNKVISAAQIRILKMPFFNIGIAYVRWGPLWRVKHECNDPGTLWQMIKVLKEEFVIKQKLLLRVIPNGIETDVPLISSFFEKEGFLRRSSVFPYRTFIVDLRSSLEELRKALDPKWRNKLNGAQKNKLEIVEGFDNKLYLTFLTLQREVLERKKFEPGVDYEEFEVIQNSLSEKFKMKIFICEHEGEPVSAAVISAIGDTAIYLFGATGNKGMNQKGSYLLQWRVIEWLKEHGCLWYDLGGINPEENPGVFRFKAGLSGKEVTYPGQFEIWQDKISYILCRSAEALQTGLKKLRNYESRAV